MDEDISRLVLSLLFLTIALPWGIVEILLDSSEHIVGIRAGFIVGLICGPILYKIYDYGFKGKLGQTFKSIGLSFLSKAVILIGTSILMWGIWRIHPLYYLPSLFYSLLFLTFFAIYFAMNDTTEAEVD